MKKLTAFLYSCTRIPGKNITPKIKPQPKPQRQAEKPQHYRKAVERTGQQVLRKQ